MTQLTGCTFGALRADDFGSDDGRTPIVLLPGLTFDRGVWAPVIDCLRDRDAQRRIVAIDLPGQGASPPCPPHDLPDVVEVLHDALDAAGITTPLLVGHSMAAALASLYAARHPAAGVVNVDQPPVIADFARLLRSLEPRLRGPAFDDVWREVFFASFRTDLLPETARELVTQHSRPTQELVLSYWQILLDRPLEDTEALIERALTGIAARDIPYVLVLGGDLDDAVRAHLLHRLPRMRVVEWLGTGHFPHLARPAEFADLLDQLGGASA